MSYLGVPPFGQTVRTITEITADSDQSTFLINGGYITGYVDVYLNGVALASSDFTATDNTNIVLSVAAEINDEFKSIAYFPVSLMDTYRTGEVDTLIANLDSDLSDVNTSIANLDSDLSNLDALPSQTGNSGNYLTTDGSNASWAALDTDANSTTKGLYEMANTISTNYTITAGNNAISAGPITVTSGVLVTVPSGSRWAVI